MMAITNLVILLKSTVNFIKSLLTYISEEEKLCS
nr:MAG TPA: hypothetical protein [Caudoviricetes sp.]